MLSQGHPSAAQCVTTETEKGERLKASPFKWRLVFPEIQDICFQPECLNKVRCWLCAGTGFWFPCQRDGGTADVGHLRFGRSGWKQVGVYRLAGLNNSEFWGRRRKRALKKLFSLNLQWSWVAQISPLIENISSPSYVLLDSIPNHRIMLLMKKDELWERFCCDKGQGEKPQPQKAFLNRNMFSFYSWLTLATPLYSQTWGGEVWQMSALTPAGRLQLN